MPIELNQTIPIFRIFDVDKAKAFYVGFLGFTVDWEHRFSDTAPLYMQVSRGGVVLHLSEHHGDCCPGPTAYVRMTGIDDYHSEITARNYEYMRPGVEKTFHNSRGMVVTDPFGNRIRFDEPLAADDGTAE